MKKKERDNKKRKKIYNFKLNKGFFILIFGLILFLFALFFKLIIGPVEIVSYFCFSSYLLIYLGIVVQLLSKDNKLFLKSFNYIKSSKTFIYWIIVVFFFFALIGFFFPVPEFLEQKILEILSGLVEKIEGISNFNLIKFILFNNLQSSFIGIISGVFFGIFSFIGAVFNGYVLGFVLSLAFSKEGFLSLLSLLPHGIFELPAIFISLGLGVKLGSFIFHKNKKKFLKENFVKSLVVFLLIITPLLILAAIIEGFLIAYIS